MLNYIRAELYKAAHRKYPYIALAVMLVLEACLASGFAFHNSHSFATPFGEAVSMICAMGSVGVWACLLTGDIVFAGQYKNGTLKNEVAFGLSRTRIYLGKLIAMTLLSFLFLVIMAGFYMGLCALILPHNLPGFPTDGEGLIYVGYFLATALPIWVGTQGAACMCLFLVQSDVAASFAYAGLTFAIEPCLQILGAVLRNSAAGQVMLKICDYLPLEVLGNAMIVVGDLEYLGRGWLVGAFWLAVSTAVGLYGFKRKEIK